MDLDVMPEACDGPAIKEWWTMVASLGCIVTRKPSPTIHHIHSGSVAKLGASSGVALRGVNDYLDRDGSRTPIDFTCGLGLEKRMEAQVVQAATKWKRMALAQFDCAVGQGINTDMRAVRKDYFLDHDHPFICRRAATNRRRMEGGIPANG